MPTILTPTITDAGVAAAAAQGALGLSLIITHVLVGAGSIAPAAQAAATALAAPRHKGIVIGSANVGSLVYGNALVSSAGYAGAQFAITEIAFYAGDPDAGGTLAMILCDGSVYGVLGGGVVADISMAIQLRLFGIPPGSITLNVDPNANVALAAIADHVASNDPHPQYNTAGKFVGEVFTMQGAVPPRGALLLAGMLVNRLDYPALWEYAKANSLVVTEAEWAATGWTLYSEGDGSTTFRIPDYRGEFPRYWDFGRGVDPSRLLGRWQGDQNKAHTHAVPLQAMNSSGTDGWGKLGTGGMAAEGTLPDLTAQASGGTEARPRNVALLACVWAGAATQVPLSPSIPSAPVAPVTPPPAPAPAPGPAPAPTPPVADFYAIPTTVYGGDSVLLTALGSDVLTSATWEWAYDSVSGVWSSAGTGRQVSFKTPLSYDVQTLTIRLTVANANGTSSKVIANMITVLPYGGGWGGGGQGNYNIA